MALLRSRVAALLTSIVWLSSCWNPFKPSSSQDFGSFTWTDAGQSYTSPKNGSKASRGGGNIFIIGTTCSERDPSLSLTIFGGAGSSAGTYAVTRGNTQGAVSAIYDDGTIAEPTAGNLADDWNGDSGTLVITSVTSSRIAGNFNIVLVPQKPQNPATGTRTLTGSFDVIFTEDHSCGN